MYYDLIRFPIRHEALKWEAREAFLDVDGRPQLFLRVKLTGTEFPVGAQIPQVWVGDVYARKVVIDEDHRAVRAYFGKPYPRRGNLDFGHLGRAELDFGRFERRRIVYLDRKRLSSDVVLSLQASSGRNPQRRPPGR